MQLGTVAAETEGARYERDVRYGFSQLSPTWRSEKNVRARHFHIGTALRTPLSSYFASMDANQ